MSELQKLRTFPLFKGLDDGQFLALSKVLTFERLPDGHVFARTGKESKRANDTLCIILEGEVSVTTKPADKNQVPVERRMQAGEMFGLITFLKGGPRTATTRAVNPVHVASLSHEQYEQVVRPNPTLNSVFLFAVASQLARDVRACNQRLVKAAQGTASPDQPVSLGKQHPAAPVTTRGEFRGTGAPFTPPPPATPSRLS